MVEGKGLGDIFPLGLGHIIRRNRRMRSRVPLFHYSGALTPSSAGSRRFLRTQPVFHSKEKDSESVNGSGSNDTNNLQPNWLPSLVSPKQLVEYLNDYVVGQTRAKKILAVAYVHAGFVLVITHITYFCSVYNHYNRVRANLNAGLPEIERPWESTGS